MGLLVGLTLTPMPAIAADDDALPPGTREFPVVFKPFGNEQRGTNIRRGDRLVGQRVYDGWGHIVRETLTEDGRNHGPTRTWYPNGKLRALTTYRDGRLDGPARAWDDQGCLLWQADLVGGTGVLKAFHPNAVLESEGPYQAGRKSGNHREWYADGMLVSDISYEDDRINGWARSYHRNGRPRSAVFCRGGHYHGVKRVWDDAGRLVNGHGLTPEATPAEYGSPEPTPYYYVAGKRVSRAEYDVAAATDPDLRRALANDRLPGPDPGPAGSTRPRATISLGLAGFLGLAAARGADDDRLPPGVRQRDVPLKPHVGAARGTLLLDFEGQEVGRRTYDEADRLVAEQRTRDGHPDGPQRTWHPNGCLRSLVTYKDGRPDGPAWARDDRGGTLWQTTMHAGDGVLRDYHSGSTLGREAPYHHGMVHGVERQWDDAGRLLSDTAHEADRRHGADRRYDREGRLCYEATYRDGQLNGVERQWGDAAADRPGPAVSYYLLGRRVPRPQFEAAAAADPELRRMLPPEP